MHLITKWGQTFSEKKGPKKRIANSKEFSAFSVSPCQLPLSLVFYRVFFLFFKSLPVTVPTFLPRANLPCFGPDRLLGVGKISVWSSVFSVCISRIFHWLRTCLNHQICPCYRAHARHGVDHSPKSKILFRREMVKQVGETTGWNKVAARFAVQARDRQIAKWTLRAGQKMEIWPLLGPRERTQK